MNQPTQSTSISNVYPSTVPVIHVPSQTKTPAEQMELLTDVFEGLSETEVDEIIEIVMTRKPLFGE
jgi:predicted RNase H-like HicB family nuclease